MLPKTENPRVGRKGLRVLPEGLPGRVGVFICPHDHPKPEPLIGLGPNDLNGHGLGGKPVSVSLGQDLGPILLSH